MLSDMNPVHNFTPCIPNIHFNIVFPNTPDLLRGLLPSYFPAKILYAFLISPMGPTCIPHLSLPNLIALIIFGEVY